VNVEPDRTFLSRVAVTADDDVVCDEPLTKPPPPAVF